MSLRADRGFWVGRGCRGGGGGVGEGVLKITVTWRSQVPLTAAPRAKIDSSINTRREREGQQTAGDCGDDNAAALVFLPLSKGKCIKKREKKEKKEEKKKKPAS